MLEARCGHDRNDKARPITTRSNADFAKSNRHCACYLAQGGFRSLIGRIIRKAQMCAEAGYVDNRASTSFGKFHHLCDHPAESERGESVDGKSLQEIAAVIAIHWLQADAGIIYQPINPAMFPEHAINYPLKRTIVGNIANFCFIRIVCPGVLDIESIYTCIGACQAGRDCCPVSASRSGYDDDSSFHRKKIRHH